MTGVLRRDPYPALQVERRRVWLVGRGKFGADRALAAIPGGPVTVSGAWIERGRHRMLEMGSGTKYPVAPNRGQAEKVACPL